MPLKHKIITRNGTEIVNLTFAKAIKFKCLDCSGWQHKDVKHCPITTCALYPYRLGKDPSRKGTGMAVNLKNACSSEIMPTQVGILGSRGNNPMDGMPAITLH